MVLWRERIFMKGAAAGGQKKNYQKELEKCGVQAYICTPETQKLVMHLIYDCIKAGLPADKEALAAVDAEVKAAGCKGALLACTELSVIKADEHLDDFYTDPMEVMAERAIVFMGKTIKKAASPVT